MNLLKPTLIEDHIIALLQKKPETGANLLNLIQKKRPGTTKQALYTALRKLKSEETVIMNHKRIFLSSLWIDRMNEFFAVAKHCYEGQAMGNNADPENFLRMSDGDKISYIFKNPDVADILWGHAFNVLTEKMNENEPVYLYNPHEWFLLARKESEQHLIAEGNRAGHPWRVFIASKNPLDDYAKSLVQYPSLAHTESKKYFKDKYLNVFGDFIIEVSLDPKTTLSIDKFYETHSTWNDQARIALMGIVLHMKGKNKLTISRNSRKAEKVKRVLRKYFE